jgi:signal transduction histidine kinase/DNA-binding response OmpR family regulator
MSKKQLYSRLDGLFSNAGEDAAILPPDVQEKGNGWTWESRPEGIYTNVSTEVETYLGIPPASFIDKSVYEFAIGQESGDQLRNILEQKKIPADIVVPFYSANAKWVNVRVHIIYQRDPANGEIGLHGYCRVLQLVEGSMSIGPAISPQSRTGRPPVKKLQFASESIQTSGESGPAQTDSSLTYPLIVKGTTPWTRAGIESLLTQKPASQARVNGDPASLAVPLQFGNQGRGILEIIDENRETWSDDERLMVQEVVNQLMLALENARLYNAAQNELTERIRAEDEILRRNLELEAAAEIARDTTSTLALDSLLNRIVNMVSERFGFYFAALYLLDESGQNAVVQEATGDIGKTFLDLHHQIPVESKTVVGSVAADGNTICLNDVRQSPLYTINPLLPETQSELALPLKLSNRIIGVLDIQSTDLDGFQQNDIAVLQILTDQIAVAIDNARSYALAQQAIVEMREVDRLKSQFLANMSHELRTPLNSIIGFSKVILKGIDGPINDIQQEDLSAIYNSGQHLLSLINNILDLSKIEAGKMELSFTEIDLHEIIKSVMSTAVGLVKDKPVKLKQIVPEDIPLVTADATRIRQILLNLISNAAKFTDEGLITVEVARSRDENGHAELMITVTDSGPGIAKEDEIKLFQRFSQVDDSPTRKTGGTGLGLSICRSLVELHKGQIGLLWSEPGKGSTFYFTLPLGETGPTGADSNGQGLTVLSIDDDLQVIRLYERYLNPLGYSVIAVTDPREALNQIKSVKPFAITLDVMMPDKDGWQVLQEIKNDPETKDIPILMCTIVEDRDKGFTLGAADYLVKPFLREDLTRALNRLNPNGKIHKILVVDDAPDDLRLVKKMIEDAGGYEVIEAGGGIKGWEEMQANPPDAVVLDLFMPDMDGFSILQNMRSNAALMDIPVLVLTGADLTAEQSGQIDEFNHYLLAKGSLNQKEILSMLETSLNRLRG